MRVLSLVACVIAGLAVGSCSRGSSPPTSPLPASAAHLSVSPDTLTVTSSSLVGTVSISTDASAGEMWRAISKPSWAALNPDSGIATTAGETVTVTADTTGLAYGDYWGTVVLAAVSDTATLAVRLSYVAPRPFFEETFDGPLDATVWRTGDLTSGMRWCDTNAGSAAGPGSWLDPSVSSCHGITQPVPFGSAVLAGGALQLSSMGSQNAFPALVSRLPGTVAIFPTTGDFRFTARMRIDHGSAWGTGLTVVRVDSTVLSGTQYLHNGSDVVLQVWADPAIGLYSAVSGTYQGVPATITPADAYHEYAFSDSAGAFTFTVDGAQVYGPVTSAMRPTAIVLGNPLFSWWGAAVWTGFTIDDVRVDRIGP